MSNKKTKFFYFFFLKLFLFFFPFNYCFADIQNNVSKPLDSEFGMTLWQTIVSGGFVMIVLAFLSVIALSLILYYFLNIKQNKLLPENFLENIFLLIREKKYDLVKEKCSKKNNLIASILYVGLSRMKYGNLIIKESMQDEGKRCIDSLQQKLSYLADVAAIAPMVGLLGTVIGMIQAFNVIAFQTGAVKPILLASGISKAMVTTASGLIIAIPSMIFYSFFKGKVQDIIARLENVATELCHLITEELK